MIDQKNGIHEAECDCDACHIKNPQCGCECESCVLYFYEKAESDAVDHAIEESRERKYDKEDLD